MDSTTDERGRQEISLLDSLNGEWIKLPLAVVRDIGPAAQTLGGLLKVTNKETYSAASAIASKARLPIRTVRRHLVTLHHAGWINNRGREHTRRGRPRRTATLALTKHTLAAIDGKTNFVDQLLYGMLPWWACGFPWSARAVLALVMARLCSLKAAAVAQDGHSMDADDIIGSIANMGDEGRFRFTLDWLGRHTGLTHDSITAAKRHLHKLGVVEWQGSSREDGGTAPDRLVPNWDFRVIVTPTSPSRCRLDFYRGAKSGR
jgi:hypothetical protein